MPHLHQVTIRFPRLDIQTLRILGISDAAFANNKDLTSQLGVLVFLAGGNDCVIPLCFKYYKSRRVTRSVLAAELISFANLFDQAFTIAKDLAKYIPLKKYLSRC